MDDTSAILLGVLIGGIAASLVRLPPLVGFLAAGFVLSALGVEPIAGLDTLADLGVTILLFGVGLKINLRSLLYREVWLTATVHLAGTTVLAAGFLGLLATAGIGLAAEAGLTTWVLIGFALSFSSTVFVVKVLDDHGQSSSLGGRTALGILIIQDIAAVLFLATAEGTPPSPWAVLLIFIIPVALVARRVLAVVGHGELLPLFGIVLALVPGYAAFDAFGVKGDVGALLLGMLLAGQPRAGELAKSLFDLKDLLLIAFFVSIGLGGLPSISELALALALLLLLPLKAVGYALLLWICRMRRRTSVLTGISLANFSEFGLIVVVAAPASLVDDDWLRVVAGAVAASFVVASLPGRHPEYLASLMRRLLPDRTEDQVHPEDRPLRVGDAQAIILGMGRVGAAAYARLRDEYGLRVLGLEASRPRYQALMERELNVVEADATDPELWTSLPLDDVELVLLAMPFHGNNLDALEQLRDHGYRGVVAVATQYDEDFAQALERGADTGCQLYDGAGTELADRAADARGDQRN